MNYATYDIEVIYVDGLDEEHTVYAEVYAGADECFVNAVYASPATPWPSKRKAIPDSELPENLDAVVIAHMNGKDWRQVCYVNL